MVQIFNECEKYGFEILDDGIYQNDVKLGEVGFYYYPNGTELAEQFGGGWRYALMPDKNSDELFHFQESQVQPLTPEELFFEITAEIEFYQSQIAILQQQLAVVTGGSTNG